MHEDADKATSFIAIATYQNEGGPTRKTASFPPGATIGDVFAAFFTNLEFSERVFLRTPSSIELMPDHLTIPRKSEASRWDLDELLGGTPVENTKAT